MIWPVVDKFFVFVRQITSSYRKYTVISIEGENGKVNENKVRVFVFAIQFTNDIVKILVIRCVEDCGTFVRNKGKMRSYWGKIYREDSIRLVK